MNNEALVKFQQNLLSWFDINQRKLPWRETKDAYKIWVSEIMLQQTQVIKVCDYYLRFIKAFPDVRRLAQADLEEVLKLWEGLGYYARARNLLKAAKLVAEKNDATIQPDYASFRSLPGVGDYVAAAVLSQSFNLPYAVVDGNVKRVLARLFLIEAPINKAAGIKLCQEKADFLLQRKEAGNFNQAMMELGATICRPRCPLCDQCPVSEFCLAQANKQQNRLPLSVSKRTVPQYHLTIGVIHKNDRVLIVQRRSSGLLGGLWEFPGGKIDPQESASQACHRKIKERVNLLVHEPEFITRVKHIYSHFKIEADIFRCQYKSGVVTLDGHLDYRWIKLTEVDHYPFHKAVHKFLPLLKHKS